MKYFLIKVKKDDKYFKEASDIFRHHYRNYPIIWEGDNFQYQIEHIRQKVYWLPSPKAMLLYSSITSYDEYIEKLEDEYFKFMEWYTNETFFIGGKYDFALMKKSDKLAEEFIEEVKKRWGSFMKLL